MTGYMTLKFWNRKTKIITIKKNHLTEKLQDLKFMLNM